MAGYKFKMQNILELKESVENEKKNQYGLAQRRLEEEKEKLKELLNELQILQKQIHTETEKGLPLHQLKEMIGFIDYCKKKIMNQKTKIKMSEDYLKKCREELIEATKERKMMEKLKVKDYNRYLYEEQKKEEKLVDDLVSFKERIKSAN